jgi:hypothetical protein
MRFEKDKVAYACHWVRKLTTLKIKLVGSIKMYNKNKMLKTIILTVSRIKLHSIKI